jgi:hypothetical protein
MGCWAGAALVMFDRRANMVALVFLAVVGANRQTMADLREVGLQGL